MNQIKLRETVESDLEDILRIEEEAFGSKEEAQLVKDLLNDPTAQPCLSLLAYNDVDPVGHILFTRSLISGLSNPPDSCILAPLAVIPSNQNSGIGSLLVNEGLRVLKGRGMQLVFVLGHKNYYPRFGFKPDAAAVGLRAPYPIPPKDADAWMVLELKPGIIGKIKGEVKCAEAMNRQEYWVE